MTKTLMSLLDKIFENIKILCAVTAFCWLIFFFGDELGFELSEMSNKNYRYAIIGLGLFGSCAVVVHLISLLWKLMQKIFRFYQERQGYLRAIETVRHYGDKNLNGLDVLRSFYDFPPGGELWQKKVPRDLTKSLIVTGMLDIFSKITVKKSSIYDRKLLRIVRPSSYDGEAVYSFEFNEGFFKFLEEFFKKTKHQKVDLSDNFLMHLSHQKQNHTNENHNPRPS